QFGTAKLRAFSDPRMRGQIIEWRDQWAHAPRSAHYAMQVLSRPGLEIASVAAAGIGASVAFEIAHRLGLECITFGELIGADEPRRLNATRYAPAVAVAMLA
ncbi:MAG: hypothetical protein ABL893_15590, partial [Hyphomicrobium sp.]